MHPTIATVKSWVPNEFKQKGLEMMVKWAGPDKADELCQKYLDKPLFLALEKFAYAHLERYAGSTLVPVHQQKAELFNVYYGNKDANEIVPEPGTNFAASYGPYLEGKSKILINNFYSRNYGVRDPLLLRISIFQNQKVWWTEQHILPANKVFYWEGVPEAERADLPSKGMLVVEVIHPNLRSFKNHIRCFFMLRDEEAGTICGVHAGAIPVGIAYALPPGDRGFAPQELLPMYNDFFHEQLPLQSRTIHEDDPLVRLKTDDPIFANGFYTSVDSKGVPRAIWHDHNRDGGLLPIRPEAKTQKSKYPCVTTFYVPDFQLNVPMVLFNPMEVGFQPQEITVTLHNRGMEVLAQRELDVREGVQSIDLKTLFAQDEITGEIIVIVDFGMDFYSFDSHRVPPCYLHVYYRCGDELADQIHTLYTYGYKNHPFPTPASNRCRKMGPLTINEGLKYRYTIITTGGVKQNPDTTVNFRVFTDTGSEHVINNYPLINDGITIVEAETLPQEIFDNMEKSAVIWMEHETTNFFAHWYAIDEVTGHVGGDHFTGG